LSDEQKQDTEILAVSIDPPADLQRAIDRIARNGPAPAFPFLSDPGHRVIGRYGLLNPGNARGIPHPTTLVIDRQGVVRWKFIEIDYRIRPTNEMVLEALEAVRGGG
jgi:peroxiredoxin